MTFKDFLTKIASRKFIAMIGTMVTAVLVYKGADENTIAQVGSVVGAIATAITYIVTEGQVDKARANAPKTIEATLESTIELPVVTDNTDNKGTI